MNRFDLYVMIFYTLDADWDKTKNEELGLFLSGMNPVLFKGEGSAVPDYYAIYCDFLNDREISVDNSFAIAKEYISFLNKDYVSNAFEWIDAEKWSKGLNKYLEEPYPLSE